MSRIVYLKDGTKCKLISETDNGYIVAPYLVTAEDNEEFELISDNLIKADKVYGSAPIEVIDSEYNAILRKVEDKRAELDQLKKEYNTLLYSYKQCQAYKTDLSRYIINREELRQARVLVVFPHDSITPVIMDGQKGRKITVIYEISQYPGEEKVWSYKFHGEKEGGYWSSGQAFDPECGIMVDPTPEQVREKALERQIKTVFSAHVVKYTPNEWLTAINLRRKEEYIRADHDHELKKAEQDFADAETKLNMLKQGLKVGDHTPF